LERLVLNAGSGDDNFFVAGVAAGTQTTINAGFGNDVIHMGTALANLTNSTLRIDGGIADRDTLDYSLFTSSVQVNLNTLDLDDIPAQTGTGVQTGGLTNFENVIGGSGDDTLVGSAVFNILVGNGGSDTLNGADGRDILIGGTGNDIMNGAGDDDILIGGTTDHDNNLTALNAIMQEWISSADFNTRVSALRAGVLGGTVKLDSTTVHDDGVFDAIVGDDGSNWGWIFNTDSFALIQQIN
jgi:hypothetical protein